METIFSSDAADIYFDSTIPCIIWKPKKFHTGEEFRSPFNAGMEYAEKIFSKYPKLGWLNDLALIRTLKTSDISWLDENVNMRGISLGMKKVAFALPSNLFARVVVKFYVEMTNRKNAGEFEIKSFKTLEQTRAWLKEGSLSEEVEL